MNIILRKSGNKIGLYIDKQLATIFENTDFDAVKKWINKNLLNAKVYISE